MKEEKVRMGEMNYMPPQYENVPIEDEMCLHLCKIKYCPFYPKTDTLLNVPVR